METRAHFVVIGAFTIGIVVAAFFFVMWVAGYGAAGVHRRYQIVFTGSVSGLSTGANVLFNGLKVGEVTKLSFVERNPNQVVADIDVTNASAPINSDTKAQLETQGLTGSAAIALIGGAPNAPPLVGEDGRPPVIPSLPTATLADLQTKAGYVLDLANKILVDNAQGIHNTVDNVQTFSLALRNNAGNVDAALKSVSELGKTLEPLATRLQTLSEDADKLVVAIDREKVRAIVGNVESASGKASSVLDRADKVLAENSSDLHAAIANISGFAKTLNDNRDNVDAALKGAAELGKNVEHIQGLVDDADKVVKAIDTEKLHGVVDNVESVSRALSASSDNYQTVMREGASLATRLNDAEKALGPTIGDIDGVFKAIDPKKVSGIVDSISNVASTVEQNRGNIDRTIKNASEFTAKLNDSADKLDGLITSAQSFLGAPGTKGAMSQIGDAAQSVKKLADDLDVRVKEISVGLSRFSNSGLRQYESLAIQGQRVLDDIDQAVRSFKSNPSQIIWGAKQTLPEYRSGQ